MIANPIIQRELLGVLRRPQTLAMFSGMLAVLVIVIIAMWPDDASVSLDGRQARQLFRVFSYGLLVCLMMVVPAYPATAIVRERRAGTLHLLLTSPLRPIDIFIGKVSGAVGVVALLLIISVPASIACHAMGGIDLGQVSQTYGVLAAMSLQFTMVALIVSSYARSPDSALRFTYGIVLGMAVITIAPYKLMQGQIAGLPAEAIKWIYCISPIPAITELTGHGDVAALGIVKDFDPIGRYLFVAALTVVGVGVWLALRLRPSLLDQSRAAGKATDDRSKGEQLMRRVMYMWFFDPQRRSKPIGRRTNPVMVKEFRTRALGRAHWLMRVFAICLVISLMLMYGTSEWSKQNAEADRAAFLGGVIVLVQMALVVLATPALSAGLISTEQESGGWSLLQVTRISARQIVTGKLMSVAVTVAMLLVATLPAYAVLLVVDATYIPRLISVTISIVLTATFALVLGAACSAVLRKTAAATTAAYGVMLVLCVGTFIVWLGRGSVFGEQLVANVMMFNPVATALSLMNMPGFESYNVPLSSIGGWTALGDVLAGVLPADEYWRAYFDNAPMNWLMLIVATAVCGVALWIATWRMNRPQ